MVLLDPAFALLEPVAVTIHLEDVNVMGEAVEQRAKIHAFEYFIVESADLNWLSHHAVPVVISWSAPDLPTELFDITKRQSPEASRLSEAGSQFVAESCRLTQTD